MGIYGVGFRYRIRVQDLRAEGYGFKVKGLGWRVNYARFMVCALGYV